MSWVGHPVPSRYLRLQPKDCVAKTGDSGVGYISVENIEETTGQMLPGTWREKCHDDQLRTNLFRSLSRVLLSISRVRLPRIGSFVIENNGYLRLANRLLSVEAQDLENEQIPTGVPRDYTYSTVDSSVMDILRFHDNRVLHQPNAINNLSDYSALAAAFATMRTVYHPFSTPVIAETPSLRLLTVFNQSNIFVDKQWNITCLVDLEWICSQPI